MSEREELEFEVLLQRIGELVPQLEALSPDVRDPVFELLDYMETWHREGIMRLAVAVPPDALMAAREDPIVATLLDTYLADDDDVDPASAVEEALEEIRPYVHSHGGEMELARVDGGIVTLRLLGACDGCPSSSLTLTQGVEQILRDRWPGFVGLRIQQDERHDHGAGAKQPLLQIQSMRRS